MRAAGRIVTCAVVMLVATARPADAFWRFLEHMSGPGWYDGFTYEYKLWCQYPDEPGKPLIATLSGPCKFVAEDQDRSQPRRQTFGLSGGLMWSTINRLQYAPLVQPEDTQVWVVTGGPFYDYRLSGLLNRVEVGASAEGYVFFGKTTKTMLRLALEPRATVTLGTIRSEHTGRPVLNLKVRAGALWILPGFDTEDFGALPGERLGPEVLTSIRIVVDFECWPWKKDC